MMLRLFLSSFLLFFAEIRFRGFNEKVNIFSFR
jgi:hypothetical protein